MKIRKLFALLVSLCMVVSLLPVGAGAAFANELFTAGASTYGDADGNGVVDLRDVLLIEQHFAGETVEGLVPDHADVNLDGEVNLVDAKAIREYLVNARPSLQPATCTVSFDTAGGNSIDSISAVKGFAIPDELPTPDKQDAFFSGWQLDGQPFYQDDYVLSRDIKLTATYEEMGTQEALLIDSFTLNDLQPNHAFGITGGASAAAVLAGVSLTPKDGSDPVTLEAKDDNGVFRVSAKGGFNPGSVYELRLLDEALGFEGEDASMRMVSFTVHKDERDNLEYNANLKFIQDTDAMDYTMNGETTPTLSVGVLTGEDSASTEGTFTYDGQLKEGDFVCVYVGTDPRDRDYAANDYEDQPLGLMKIKGGSAGSYTFVSVGEDELDQVLMIPDTIPFKVSSLPTGAVGDEGSVDKDDFDADARAHLGKTETPKYNVGDLLVFYTVDFSLLTEETSHVYGQVTSVIDDTVNYKIITKDDIEVFSGMFVSTPMDSDEIMKAFDQDEFLADVEAQVMASGFLDEATSSMTASAFETEDVIQQLKDAGFSDEEIAELATQAADEAAALQEDTGTAVASSTDIALQPQAGGTGKKMKYAVEGTSFDTKILVGDRYDNSVGVALDVGAVLSVSKATDSVVNYVKIDLAASFEEQVYFDVDLNVDIDWDFYLCIPYLDEVTCSTSISIKNYTAFSVSARVYTFSEAKIVKWDDLYNSADQSDYMLENAETFKKIDKIATREKKKQKDGGAGGSYDEQLDALFGDLPTVVVGGQEYSDEAVYTMLKDELGMTDVSASYDEVLSSTNEEDNRVGIENIMTKYGEMLNSECGMLQLFDQELCSITIEVGVFAVQLSANFVVRAKANIALGADVEYEVGKRYDFWIKVLDRTSGSNETDLLDERFGFQFYVMGNLGLRVGVKTSIDFGLITPKVASVGASVEFGPYLELWGYFFYIYDRTRPANTDTWEEQEEMQGALYLEFGLYLTVKFKAQALAGIYSYEPTICDKQFPLLTAGERYNVYDFSRYPEKDEVLRIYDEDVDISNGIGRTLPSSYLMMNRMDLTTADKDKLVYDYGKYDFELSSEYFQVDPATGLISVTPPAGERYLECDMRVVWKSDKVAFSKYDIDITIPLVWTTMTSLELNERFGVSVLAGSVEAGYSTVWSQTVGRLDVFNLPAPVDVLDAMGYNRYTLVSDSTVNLRYANEGAYADTVTQTEGITGIYADTSYLYNIDERQYTLTVEGVQQSDGTITDMEFNATYGEAFDLSALQSTGQTGPAAFTSFTGLTRVDGAGVPVDVDMNALYAGFDFYDTFNGFEGTCTANYLDSTRTLTFNFIGLTQDGSVVQADQPFKSGTKPIFDVAQFVNDYVKDPKNNVQLQEGYVMHVEGIPDIGILDSSVSFDIACQAQPSEPVWVSFVTNSESTIEPRVEAAGLKATAPPVPVKEGHEFAGWYTDASLASNFAFDFATDVIPNTEDALQNGVTLYAKWEVKSYTVTLDFQQGIETTTSFDIDYDTTYGDKLVQPKEFWNIPATPPEGGYTAEQEAQKVVLDNFRFLGWSTKTSSGSSDDMVTGETEFLNTNDVTLYAQWEEKAVLNVADEIKYADGRHQVTFDRGAHPFEYVTEAAYNAQPFEFTFLADKPCAQVAESENPFTVSYIHHATAWDTDPVETTEAPITAGSYDIKIKRATDDTYKAVEYIIQSTETAGMNIQRKRINLANYDPTVTVGGMSLAVTIPLGIEGDGRIAYQYCQSNMLSNQSYWMTSTSPSISLLVPGVRWSARIVGTESENYVYTDGDWITSTGNSSMSNAGYTVSTTIHTADLENSGTDAEIYAHLVYPLNPSPDPDEDLTLYAKIQLDKDDYNDFERNHVDTYTILGGVSPWMVAGIQLHLQTNGTSAPDWYAQSVKLTLQKPPATQEYSDRFYPPEADWLGGATNVWHWKFTTGNFKREIQGIGSSLNFAGALDLNTATTDYEVNYNGQVRDQFIASGTYNAFNYYDPPTYTLAAVGEDGTYETGNPAYDRFVQYISNGRYSIDVDGLKAYMLENDITEGFDYKMTYAFSPETTYAKDNNGSKVDAVWSKTIHVTAPESVTGQSVLAVQGLSDDVADELTEAEAFYQHLDATSDTPVTVPVVTLLAEEEQAAFASAPDDSATDAQVVATDEVETGTTDNVQMSTTTDTQNDAPDDAQVGDVALVPPATQMDDADSIAPLDNSVAQESVVPLDSSTQEPVAALGVDAEPRILLGERSATGTGFDLPVTLEGGVPLWALFAEVESDATLTGCTLGDDVFTASEFTLGNDLSANAWRFIGNQDTLENTSAGGELLTLHFDGAIDDEVSLKLLQAISIDGKVLIGDGIYKGDEGEGGGGGQGEGDGGQGQGEGGGQGEVAQSGSNQGGSNGTRIAATGDSTSSLLVFAFFAFLVAGSLLVFVARRRSNEAQRIAAGERPTPRRRP